MKIISQVLLLQKVLEDRTIYDLKRWLETRGHSCQIKTSAAIFEDNPKYIQQSIAQNIVWRKRFEGLLIAKMTFLVVADQSLMN